MSNLSKIQNSSVLLRVDFNVQINPSTKKIIDTTRIKKSLPTIQELIKNNNKITICSHFGRPDPEKTPEANQEFSLQQIIPELQEILDKELIFITEYPSQELQNQISKQTPQQIIILENTRFHKQEIENQEEWAKELSKKFDYFIFDAFGASHRQHATTYAIQKFLPSLKGILVQNEINNLQPLLQTPSQPFTLILGGAKIKTKIGVIQNFLDKANHILIGGALANTFLKAQGYQIGQSKYEPEKIEIAKQILDNASKSTSTLLLPLDYITNNGDNKSLLETNPEDSILDIGPLTISRFQNILKSSKTIIFNGPLGVYTKPSYQGGTRQILNTISQNPNTTILGGGDTLDALKLFHIPQEKFSHVSTGGGAMLKYLEGNPLPTLEKLK